jgi:hypothetical protein
MRKMAERLRGVHPFVGDTKFIVQLHQSRPLRSVEHSGWDIHREDLVIILWQIKPWQIKPMGIHSNPIVFLQQSDLDARFLTEPVGRRQSCDAASDNCDPNRRHFVNLKRVMAGMLKYIAL